ncbi:SRC kinase signaling inhibitor 1 isoform X5 [Anarrhichthys ocellatus]|uniref:SRC kinase signaling inhibitor 1 isoform X5 n=1 Tax=Anarrhichthys ocellatus TaxID=433405 RepID=UPI0012EE3122|nr:SRC kinase signaling inhibitor 1-like isoform X5 [Anarrhichthys ocellatus]
MLWTVLSILAVQHRSRWPGLTHLIASDCGLPLSPRSSVISLTNVHLFLEVLSLCSCCRPRLADRHRFLPVIERSPGTHPIKAPLSNSGACFPKQDAERGGGHMISTDDLEYPREYRTLGNSARRFSNVGLVHTSEHRHTVSAAQSLEALTNLHKVDMERKRDAFMDHLKSKYQQQQQLQHPHHSPHHNPPSPSPSHASMRGTSERSAREQQQPNYWSFKSRSPRHSQSTQSGLADQAAKLSFASAESLETMSEADIPIGFNRMNRFRQSLPLSRSASQNKLRSPDEYSGVLFLQYGDETRRVHITHELSSLDTLHALIVHMFPQKLTAGMLKSPNTAILIKDEARNVFYELEDVRDIQDRSIIKIFRKEPIYASYPAAAHLANGDLRREMVYSSRDSSPTHRINTLPSSTASASSGSPSRSRLSYSGGGRPPSFTGSHSQHEQPRHAHHPPAGHGANAGLSPSPSAILERRDVKPDEEVSAKNMALMKSEGLYADPYSLMHEGRLSIASTQSLAAIGDPFSFPVTSGLYRRGSVRSLSTYSAAALQGDLEDSLYKPGGSLYSDTYSSATLGMGFRMPPSSPQKIPDMQMRDRESYSSSPSRASPVRQSFRKDSASSSVFVESPKSRPSSSSEPLCLTAGPGEGGRATPGFGSSMSGQDPDSSRDHRLERMEAMEKQIASLTGLVQSVLTRAPDSDSTEKTETNSDGSATGTGRLKQKAHTPSAPLALMPPPPSNTTPVNSAGRLQMQLHLHGLQQNTTDLRKQLSQLRKIQMENQNSVRTLLKRTEAELKVRVADALRKQEDPLQRQRLLVEEERLKYLNEEELIIQQLHDLEKSVEEIQKESSVNHKLVTVQELEEKATLLRKLGETLTELKNQFPGLQSKMRVVLRVEVEAVKFLKEEPHRLDSLLKRCKSITDTLATMRKQANDGVWKKQEDFSSPSSKHNNDLRKFSDFDISTSPQLTINDLGGGNSLSNWSPHSSLSRGHGSLSGPHKDNHPPVPHKGKALEELERRALADKALSVEVRLAAERDWEEKRASLTQYSAQDINRLLEETQAELLKAIPDLDFAAKQIKPSSNTPSSQILQSGVGTPDHRVSKPQHKLSGKEGGSRRGSDELTVPRYRTEKPSKSPPPPPPRRSFPSSPSITSRSGEPLIPGKSIKKSESEEAESQKLHVKLRRTVSENPRPASTPPTLASGDKEEGEEERIAAELEGSRLSPVPNVVLTECLPASPTASEDPVRDTANEPVDESPSRDWTAHHTAYQTRFSKERDSSGSPPQRERCFKEEVELKLEVVLLLTELEVRVVSPVEVQELSMTLGQALQTLIISPHTNEVPEVQLRGRPLLVLLREGKTVRDAYRLLHCLLDSSKPVPKPRMKSPLRSGQQSSLVEALRRGMETGDRVLTLHHNAEIKIPEAQQKSANVKSSGSDLSVDSPSNRSQRKVRDDIRCSAYRRMDSLEETIRELENTLIEISGHPTAEQLYTETAAESTPVQVTGGPTSETKKPPVPPKPSSFSPASIQGGNSSSVKLLHSSAASKLKHLQQNSTDKTKSGRREDFLKIQGQHQTWVTSPLAPQMKALGSNSSIEPYLSGIKTGLLSGRVTSPAAAFAPGLRKYPQEGAKPSLTPSSSQAKALLVSLSASGLSAEALLLSSTLRHRRLLREQQRASSLPLPRSRSSPTTPTASSPSSSSSPTTPTPSLSPSSPTSWGSLALSPAAAPKPSSCSSSLNSCKEGGGEHVNTDLASGNSR